MACARWSPTRACSRRSNSNWKISCQEQILGDRAEGITGRRTRRRPVPFQSGWFDQKPANQSIDPLGLFMHEPVRGFRDTLYDEVIDPLTEIVD
jgi:hypothetical protein